MRHRGGLRQARFASVWLRDVRFTGTSLAETDWTDATLIPARRPGWRRSARGCTGWPARCKLDSVNFRDAELTEVVFDNCMLRDVDFTGPR